MDECTWPRNAYTLRKGRAVGPRAVWGGQGKENPENHLWLGLWQHKDSGGQSPNIRVIHAQPWDRYQPYSRATMYQGL